MVNSTTPDGSDSEDLQSLFDSIAGSARKPPTPAPESGGNGDCDDLQDLFDSIAADASAGAGGAVENADPQEAVFNRLGKMARQLHDSLRELGYDQALQSVAQNAIPDARQRLTYIAQMTEQAASKVLNAADIAKPIQDELAGRSTALSVRWDKMFANQLSVDEFKVLAQDTRGFFGEAPAKLEATNAQLLEIVMAQDFQDLTGQVIKKVVDLVQQLETQLLNVLVEVMPEARKAEAPEGLLNGPVMNAAGRDDVVNSQEQVDDLLESLGF